MVTFNPFWDASRYTAKRFDLHRVYTFQSLLGCFGHKRYASTLKRLSTFNPFWDASYGVFRYMPEEGIYHFQSLLGCFVNYMRYRYCLQLCSLSIPFGMLLRN